MSAIAILVFGPALAAVLPAAAASPKSMVAVRTSTPPRIDGALDDAVWAEAPLEDRFVQFDPRWGSTATERTEVRVLYDDRAIYVAVRAEDRAAPEIVTRLSRRDRNVESDWIAVAIDSRHDHATGYYFRVTSGGVQLDGVLFDDCCMTTDWDAVWESAVSRDAGGWSAELAIPLSVLRFSSAETQEWGFQVERYVSRKKELDMWTPLSKTAGGRSSRFGHLVGLRGLRPRRTLEARPFFVSRVRAESDAGGGFLGTGGSAVLEGQIDGGFDLKIGLTNDLTLDATFNPDFGQVEADEVVLNLSRFETFFPEKRPFFLEGVDLFQTPLQMFYSRRIGRRTVPTSLGDRLTLSDGTTAEVIAPPTPRIWAAAKLAGQASARFSVGTLAAVTAAERATVSDGPGGTPRTLELAPERTWAAARGRYSLGGASYVGAMATAVNRLGGAIPGTEADHDAFAEGLDGQWAANDGRVRIRGQVVASQRVGGAEVTRSDGTRLADGAVGWGAHLDTHAEGEHWTWETESRLLSPELDLNALGFLPAFNLASFETDFALRDTEPRGVFRHRELGAAASGAMSFDGTPTDLDSGLRWYAEYRSYLGHGAEIGWSYPGLYDIHETGDGARFERIPGIGGGTWLQTDSRRRVVAHANLGGYVDFYGGARGLGARGAVKVKPLSQLEIDLEPALALEWNNVRFRSCHDDAGAACTVNTEVRHYTFAELDSGSLSLTFRGTYTFSPRLTLQTYAQTFFARGDYSAYQTATTLGARPTINREALRPSASSGDSEDDFEEATLNVNVVLFWELLPGSKVIGVYTRAQSGAGDLAGRTPGFRWRRLGAGPVEDLFMIKLVLFWA